MLKDYAVYYRSFKGMRYWGSFKLTKAYNQIHADKKLARIAAGFFLLYGHTGEFRIEPIEGQRLKIVAGGLGCRLTPAVAA